ncbi:unnamed protein product, partial [Schistosoma turkestanicum]
MSVTGHHHQLVFTVNHVINFYALNVADIFPCQLKAVHDAKHDAKLEINEQTDRVRKSHSQFENYLRHLVKYGQELTETELNTTNQIQSRAKQLKEEIDQIANKLISQLDQQIDSETKLIDDCAGFLYPLIVQCEVACRYADALKDFGRPEELLFCFDQVNEQLNYLGQKKIEYLEARIKPYFKIGNYKYSENETETNSHLFNSSYLFGSIEYEKIVEEFVKNELTSCLAGNQQNELKLELGNMCLNHDQVSIGVNTSPRDLAILNNFHGNNRFGNHNNNNNSEFHPINLDDHYLSSVNGYMSTDRKYKSQIKEHANSSKYEVLNELEFDARVSTDLRDVWPTGLAVNQSNGDIYVVDRDNSRIKLFTHDGTFISSLGDTGEMSDRLVSPFDITISSSRGTIFVSDYQLDEIRLFSFDGRSQGTLTKDKLKHPRGVCYGIGLLAVVESRRHHISLYDIRCDSNSPVRQIPFDRGGLGLSGEDNSNKFVFNSRTVLTEPYYVEFIEDSGGCICVTDWAAPSVKLYSLTNGSFLSSIGGYGTTNDNILQPYGICYASWIKSFLISDHVNHRIQSCQIKHINENDIHLFNDFNRSTKQINEWNDIGVNEHKFTST